MRDKGKSEVGHSAAARNDPFVDCHGYVPCRKHPKASSVGICAFCLEERLLRLVCSYCGEQRLSSCSCSDDPSSNRNLYAVQVGSVGRISILIENVEIPCLQNHTTGEKPPPLLRRSSSSCVDSEKTNGIWKIGRLFRKKKQSLFPDNGDSKSEKWAVEDGDMGGGAVSRSRSSFRSCGVFDSEDGNRTVSGERSSISGTRPSSVLDHDRKSSFGKAKPRRSAFSEAECRKGGFNETFTEPRKSVAVPDDPEFASYISRSASRVFSLRESNFAAADEKGFIDLKFVPPKEFKPGEMPSSDAAKNSMLESSKSAFGSMRSIDSFIGGRDFSSGSCRINMMDPGMKKSRRSFKGWRRMFGQYNIKVGQGEGAA